MLSRYIVDYDPQADVAYVKIGRGKIEDSIEAEKDIIIDVDYNVCLVGIEILNFSKSKLNVNELITKHFDYLASVVR